MSTTEIWIALLSGGVALSIVKFWGSAIMRYWRRRETMAKALKKTHEIHSEMQLLLLESSADRVLICKTENGGGFISVDRPLYIRILQEQIQNEKLRPVRDMYQRYKIDQRYKEILYKLSQDQETWDFVTDEEAASFLKTKYQSIGISRTRFFYLDHDRDGLLYAAVSACDPDNLMDDPQTLDSFNLRIQNFSKIYKA